MPAKSVAEFIAWAKKKGHVSFGSPGVGTSPHLSGVLFAKRIGLDAVHVPFRGAAQTIPAMLSGAVDFAIDNLASYIALIQSGKMRALAVTSAKRWPTLPDVPTMEEAGVKDFVVTSWAAFVLPAATPRPIIDKLSGAMKQIAADVPMQKRFLVAGARFCPARRRRPSPSPPRSGPGGRKWSHCRGSSHSSGCAQACAMSRRTVP